MADKHYVLFSTKACKRSWMEMLKQQQQQHFSMSVHATNGDANMTDTPNKPSAWPTTAGRLPNQPKMEKLQPLAMKCSK